MRATRDPDVRVQLQEQNNKEEDEEDGVLGGDAENNSEVLKILA